MCSVDFSSPDFAKLIHLDLKGAALKLPYYAQIFPLFKLLGATGLLIEYEDMFPYDGNLKQLAQPESYSKTEVKKIQQLAEDNNLIVLPLVQTFGHLEFLLKHEKFAELREMKRYPNTLCPSHPRSQSVVLELVEQIIELHPNAKLLHLGADEVWHLGECSKCTRRMKTKKWGKEHLFLDHIYTLAQMIKQKYPQINLIIWDDMLRNISLEIIKDSGIGKLVEPMVWHYVPQDEFRLKCLEYCISTLAHILRQVILVDNYSRSYIVQQIMNKQIAVWQKYAAVFPQIWVASAFKGATEMTQLLSPPHYHMLNHKAWIQILREQAKNFQRVCGIAITGWQRFDHFTVLCELLPVGLPSLAICMQTLLDGEFTDEGHQKASRLLGFADKISLDTYPRPQPVPPLPAFPGGSVYVSCLYLANLITEQQLLLHHPSVKGAFNDYHVAHNRTNPLHIDQFLPQARTLLVNMEALQSQLSAFLSEIYYPSTVEEWLATNILPHLERLHKLVTEAEKQIA